MFLLFLRNCFRFNFFVRFCNGVFGFNIFRIILMILFIFGIRFFISFGFYFRFYIIDLKEAFSFGSIFVIYNLSIQ
jgi:TM2 domain-containing membrane protein YozV